MTNQVSCENKIWICFFISQSLVFQKMATKRNDGTDKVEFLGTFWKFFRHLLRKSFDRHLLWWKHQLAASAVSGRSSVDSLPISNQCESPENLWKFNRYFRILSTVFENHPKCRIWISQFWNFPPIFELLKLTCLVTLLDRKLQFLKYRQNWPFLTFLMNFFPTANLNVARSARNIEWGIFVIFRTVWLWAFKLACLRNFFQEHLKTCKMMHQVFSLRSNPKLLCIS